MRRITLILLFIVTYATTLLASNSGGYLSDSVSNVRPQIFRSSASPQYFLQPHIPTSPQAAAFQRVGDFKVENASGMPDIMIPLYEIDHFGYKIPLALRYIATPLKPGYNYDVNGYGWAFTIGSCISRTIEGVPDENFNFELSDNVLYQGYIDKPNGIAEDLKTYNFQFDKFNAVLPDGRSFQFFITNQNNNFQIKVSDCRFKDISLLRNGKDIQGFIVYDENGVEYHFNDADYSMESQYAGHKVAWHLSRIIIPNIKSPIYFNHEKTIAQLHIDGYDEPIVSLSHEYVTDTYVSGYPSRVNVGYRESKTNVHYKMRLLTRISCGGKTVDFNYENSAVESHYNYLANITISERGFSRTFKMDYTKKDVQGIPLALLKQITMTGSGSSLDSLVYKFEHYSSGPFYCTDYWGNWTNGDYRQNIGEFNFYAGFLPMYNSEINGSPLLRIIDKEPNDRCPYQKLNLTGRPTHRPARQATPPSYHAILRSITYPTGGKTVFDFESHQFVSATASNGDYIATKKQRNVMVGGGFRIKSITNYDSDGKEVSVKNYRYGPTIKEIQSRGLNLPYKQNSNFNQHVGYGEPVVDPNIKTFSQFSSSRQLPTPVLHMLLGLSPDGRKVSFTDPLNYGNGTNYNWRYDCHFSAVFFRNLLNGRTAVVYPEITEYHGDIGYNDNNLEHITGKTVYYYDIYDHNGDSTYFSRLEYVGNQLVLDESNTPKDYLVRKEIYANDVFCKLLQKEEYNYNSESNGISDYRYIDNYSPGCYPRIIYPYDILISRYCSIGRSYNIGTTTYQYHNNGTYKTQEGLMYNEYGLIKQREYSGDVEKKTTYKYPSLTDTTSEISRKLAERHMMSTVLECKTTASGIASTSIDGYKISYTEFPSGIFPSCLYNLSLIDGIEKGYQEEIQVLSYTNHGNPSEVVDRSGTHTVYLWDSSGQLLAEFKNATYNQLNSAMSAIGNTADFAALRNLPMMKDVQITTWTYQPLAGVSSVTDPSGRKVFYDYDGIGRLVEIYYYEGNIVSPSNKKVIKQYHYHTKTR